MQGGIKRLRRAALLLRYDSISVLAPGLFPGANILIKFTIQNLV